MFLRKRKVSSALSAEARQVYKSLKAYPQVDIFSNPVARTIARKIQNSAWDETKRELDFPYHTEPISFGGVSGSRISTDTFTDDGLVILYVHAGGFVAGGPDINSGAVIPLCQLLGAEAYAVRYSLTPEAPFPQPLEDINAFYLGLRDVIGLSRTIVAMGDSAGANLLLSSMVAWRDQGITLPEKFVLVSPVLDGTASSDTFITMQNYDPLIRNKGATSIKSIFTHYAAGADLTDPRISPVFADLAGLPPVSVLVGSREALLGDSARLTQKLRDSGVQVEFSVFDGMFHMFHLHWSLPETKQAHQRMADFLATA